ncbi:MAG: peptidoglycan DD-metalloendopeptidase family protein [Brumimicrobium sp.]|nr:peptidoglycan DD-metalloendopeptidase family protein [Brumimicrobium sp.]
MRDFLAGLNHSFSPVISFNDPTDYIHIDLSTSNRSFYSLDMDDTLSVEEYIVDYLKKNSGKVAYGGYLEKRDLYKRSTYFNDPDINSLDRNIHLGIDFWCPENTPVCAPIEGKVHSFNNNRNYGDYGPTIILEHTISKTTFYTLYGHLQTEDLDQIKRGTLIGKGKHFAHVGASSVNGNYAPHLHFQIIMDIEGCQGDYPGVCSEEKLYFYSMNCPDPNLLIGL